MTKEEIGYIEWLHPDWSRDEKGFFIWRDEYTGQINPCSFRDDGNGGWEFRVDEWKSDSEPDDGTMTYDSEWNYCYKEYVSVDSVLKCLQDYAKFKEHNEKVSEAEKMNRF